MSKFNIVDARYEEAPGYSVVTIETKYGTFTNMAEVAFEDEDIENKWDGCRFAEYKCKIDFLRAKSRAMRERARGIRHAANFIENPADLKRVFRQANDMDRRADDLRERAKYMEDAYPNYCDKMLTIRRTARSKKVAKENDDE